MKKLVLLTFVFLAFLYSCEEDPIPVTFNYITENATYGHSDGSITINILTGTPPYEYYKNDIENYGNLISGLKAGKYTIKVVDSEQEYCSKIIEVYQDEKVTFTYTTIPVSIHNGTDGEIHIAAAGGLPPYTYIKNSIIESSSNIFTGLSAISYAFKVRDSKGQESNTQNILVPEVLKFTYTSTPLSFYGASDATITVNATGGTLPYKYYKNDVENSTNIFSGLSAGTYIIKVTDSNQKSYFENVTINQLETLIQIYDSLTPPDDISIYHATFSGRNRFSVSFWYNTTGDLNRLSTIGDHACLFSIGNFSLSNPNVRLAIDLTKSYIQLRRFIFGGTGDDYIRFNNSTIWQGLHHVVITYDGTYQSLFVDNQLIDKQMTVYEINSINVILRNEYPGSSWPYAGQITKFYIYNQALTLEDVNDLYHLK